MSAAITHALAAMAGGFIAIAAYAAVMVGSDQERRFERMRGVERLLMEYGNMVSERGYSTRLDAHERAELIMREVDR